MSQGNIYSSGHTDATLAAKLLEADQTAKASLAKALAASAKLEAGAVADGAAAKDSAHSAGNVAQTINTVLMRLKRKCRTVEDIPLQFAAVEETVLGAHSTDKGYAERLLICSAIKDALGLKQG